MKKIFIILLGCFVGLSCMNMQGSDEQARIKELSELEAVGSNHHFPQLSFSFSLWDRLENTIGTISGLYLFNKLSALIREHPITSMFVAILIGVITDENKENIIAGMRKLRNSVYRVIGFNVEKTEKNKSDVQKKEINFLYLANLDANEIPKRDKGFVFNI